MDSPSSGPAPASLPPPGGSSSDVLAHLASRPRGRHRYRLDGEVARGGMGVILKVWDEDIRRHLAMKVILGPATGTASGATPSVDPRRLARFLEEAQVTGQLSHPGIVPVHELGLDDEGRVFFTMKLVQGRDLKAVFDLVFAEREGWSETRALSVLLRVCEALAFAHAHGVIHRDVKPDNVMVGDFGEVYVMDWGLARVLGTPDRHDLRLAGAPPSAPAIHTQRSEERAGTPDSPLMTMEGDVVGTPAYMSPEQARGDIDGLSARSDVYAVGAMLYHLLAGHPPYVPRGARLSNLAVLDLVIRGAPAAIHTVRRDVPAELAAIVEKAMARDAGTRYADTLELGEDLRAFLEHRVVGAYETGAWAESKKWVQRNRALAASLGAGVALLVAGLTASLVLKDRADAQASLATQRANDVLALSAIQDLADLQARAAALWPAHPAMLPELERWLSDARELVDGRPGDAARGISRKPSLAEHEAKLAELRARATLVPPAGDGGDGGAAATWEFADGQDRWWHAQLDRLVTDLRAFTAEETGGLFSSGLSAETGWGIVRRADFARSVEERSVRSPEAQRLWAQAAEAVARSPHYDGLLLAPQLGLLPIGPDPDSGLWEFAHLQSGEVAQRGADGRLLRTETTGLVLVLIPGGEFLMGAQTDPTQPNASAQAAGNESPVHAVSLRPFFLSKHELTQAQWERAAGSNPSGYGPGKTFDGRPVTKLHPVEQVSWHDCMRTLSWQGLLLPTEAQWERAARAGSSTPWSTGGERESLAGFANIADQAAARGGATWADIRDWPEFDDGSTVHAPTGSYGPNAFGLHDVHGNVWEWCRDAFVGYDVAGREGDGEREEPGTGARDIRIVRGGCFVTGSTHARCSHRATNPPEVRINTMGVRPARNLSGNG